MAGAALDLRPGPRRDLRLSRPVLPGPAPCPGGGGQPPAVPLAAADRRPVALVPPGPPPGRAPSGRRLPGPGRGGPGDLGRQAQPGPGPSHRLPAGAGRGPDLVQLLPADQAGAPLPHRRRGRLQSGLGAAGARPVRPGAAGGAGCAPGAGEPGLAVPGAARPGAHGPGLLHLGRGHEARRSPSDRGAGLPHPAAFDPAAGGGGRAAPHRPFCLCHGADRGRGDPGLAGPFPTQARRRCSRRRRWPWIPPAWP